MADAAPFAQVSRRGVLCAGGGLALALWLAPARAAGAGPVGPQLPNAFVRISSDNKVTLIIKHVEFGQGIATGLATLLADELDADWAQVAIEFAPNDDALYKNLLFGTMASGGSTGMANSYQQMRVAGATARAMLVEAAARRWRVTPQAITVTNGLVRAGRRTATFGELVGEAALVPPPSAPVLKTPDRFTLIGTDLPKIDSRAKCDGSAQFTMDVRLPGTVHSAIVHPPAFGGRARRVDAAAALALPGVLAVREVPTGVVTYARDFHTALRGRAALKVEWDIDAAEHRSSDQLYAAAEAAAATPGKTVSQAGDVVAALAAGAHRLEATYRFPYLAHAPMEPLDAVIWARDGRLDLWMGSQFQSWETNAVAKVLGIDPANAHLHQCFAGGSFGRRATSNLDFAKEAGEVAKAWGQPDPVKFVWTRENDIAGGFYRPLMVHRLSGAVDAQGNVVAWDQVVAGQSFVFGTAMDGAAVKRGWDSNMLEGSLAPGYRFGAHRLGVHVLQSKVPTSWWRSVGYSHNSYAVETFLDELLALAGRDPVDGRLQQIDDPRLRAVLQRVAAMSEWRRPRPPGNALGVACVPSFKSYVAQVAEVSRGKDGLPRVHKIWCAVDCGVPVNPGVIRAQIEGGIGFALGHVLHAELELGEGGVPRQRNFDTYRSLRIGEMPEVEVAILPSTEPPTGIGEPGVPPLGPAVANAWRRLTGTPVRQLPFRRALGIA